MPRVLWPLLHHRPIVEVVLTVTSGGQLLVRQLIADTGAATAHAGFELVLPESVGAPPSPRRRVTSNSCGAIASAPGPVMIQLGVIPQDPGSDLPTRQSE
jgi:hypothetical protein